MKIGIIRCSPPVSVLAVTAMVIAMLAAPAIGEQTTIIALPPGQADQQIGPDEVYARVALVRSELELVRLEMGVPAPDRPHLGVRKATPRQTFFHALTVFRKTERLCFEHTRVHTAEPATPEGDIQTAHVFAVVDASLGMIRQVKQELGIVETSSVSPRAKAQTDSTGVLMSLIQSGRVVDLLLEKQFGPSEVYQQTTLAVGYASQVLGRFRGAVRLPDDPVHERRKTPSNSFQRLLECYTLVQAIAAKPGLETLEIEIDRTRLDEVTSADVYDLATIIVAELAHLHGQLRDAAAPRKAYQPGRKLPADVFRRAGVLQKQLIQINDQLDAGLPSWLRQHQGQS